jgi:membrane protein
MATLNELKDLIKATAADFKNHRVPKLSASLAFYTIFTLGPMLLIIMFISKTLWGAEAKGKVYNRIRDILGDGAAQQIQEIMNNATITTNGLAAVGSIVVLVIAATTAFTEMQDSLNLIWNLRARKGKGIKLILRKRLLSFLMIATLGFLLLITLAINAVLKSFMAPLQELLPQISVLLVFIINLFVTLLVVTLLFSIIFKLLPDAMINWKDVIVGALVTALLFMLGNYSITAYIANIGFGNMYGTAGSLVALLLWIYLSSIILYSGAAFTKAYAMKYGSEIRPVEYAVTVSVVTIKTKRTVQQNENKNNKRRGEFRHASEMLSDQAMFNSRHSGKV